MACTIHPYNRGKGNTTTSVNESISSIMSRMIQIAGRVCGGYASDVYYSLSGYDYAVRMDYDYDRLLVFYEFGVVEYTIENDIVKGKPHGIQYWRLTWNPYKKEGVFTRVKLKELKKEVNNG